jgi:hypothetical protein
MFCRGPSGSVGITKADIGVSVGFVGVPYREPDTDARTSRRVDFDTKKDEGEARW